MKTCATKICAFVLALTLPGSAGPTAVGIATARGSFLVNGSSVSGNTTLLEGATVTTVKASSRLKFSSGATLQLSPSASAQVYGNRAVLLKGTGEISGASAFQFEASGIRIQTSSAARLQVVDNHVTVAALKGPAHVFNNEGVLVTTVDADTAVSLEPDPQTPTSMQGCLINIGTRYAVLDESGTAGVEVRGTMLSGLVDKRVEMDGRKQSCAQPLEGTDRVIAVKTIKVVNGASCAGARDRFMAAHPNISTERHVKAKCKVIAGVIIGGAAAGIAAAVCCKDEKQPVSIQ